MADNTGEIASRIYTLADQLSFAELSGDWNPMHVDAVAARRTQAGEPAVHGVHTLLWALDCLCAKIQFGPIARIQTQFEKFIRLDRPVQVLLVEQTEAYLLVEIHSDDGVATLVTLELGPPAAASVQPSPPFKMQIGPERQDVHIREPEDLEEMTGRLAHAQPGDAFARAFPHLAAKIGTLQVASMATITRLVGMVSPGLHSIFLGLTLDLVADAPLRSGICFNVTEVNHRFRHVTLEVAGDGIEGQVECLVRIPPVAQAAMSELSGWVANDAFAGKTALVIGGSRGLGEVTAKLVAAGGGKTIITYAVGQDDALRVAREINQAGGQCSTLQLDVRGDVAQQLAQLAHRPTHLYYFASAQIFRQNTALFSPSLLAEFMGMYTEAFMQVCTALQSDEHLLKAFYPSSVAVAERPRNMTEYAMAKSAGEILCDDINTYWSGIQVHKQRLPRILTDQTATTINLSASASALDVMKPIVLALHAE